MTRRRADFGSVRKLPSGRWQARYPDPAQGGRLRPAPHTFPTKGDATRYLAAVRADQDRGVFFDPHAGRETLADYAATWLDNRRVKGRPLAPRTRELYRSQLDRHILPTLGAAQLRHIDAAAVRAWHAGMTAEGGASATVTAQCYTLLRSIMGSAVTDEKIARNPCTIRGAGQRSTPERPAVSVPQVYALADAVDPRWRCMVLLAAFAGLRIGELAALRRSRVDLLHGTVDVAEAVAELSSGARHTGRPKSDAGRRTVAIPPHIIDDVAAHLDTYAESGPDGLVFVGPRGGPVRRHNFTDKVFRPAADGLGLHAVHFHDLRGTAATLAAIAGATTKELMHRLGHTTPGVAMRYQRATADRDAALAAALSAQVSGTVVPLRRRAEGSG